ncbi:hypothetical protein DNK59_07085 [Pseudomonas sp. TKO26]|nr:hypothetical protein DNK62_07085 [Pseudomonas sp. TKO30]PYY92938.1 hypothetical protein DNK61_07085 [Pseudomonas sp. TKO29]PYY95302.1 hypothetical protein DNK59_07085 [Pseudomonas sp. TKO26]PYZ01387.1 hypothetical protein DNK60_07085 [Pseudomonas sp. TKO14]
MSGIKFLPDPACLLLVHLLLKNRFLAPKRSKSVVVGRLFDKVQLKRRKLVAPCSFCCIGFAPKVQPPPFSGWFIG